MNTNTPAHKAKIRHLCCFLVLCWHLSCGAVPGPCKHSVTNEHLLYLRRLIGNQLQNGCSITYNFTERQSLSEICYIKAALPHILDLLETHFRYGIDSDNNNYSRSLKIVIQNIYSEKCIPPVNEEIEDNPVKFAKLHQTSPRVGLEKAEEVFQMYKNLVTKSEKPIEWNCEDEYAEVFPLSTSTYLTHMSGPQECQCPCTKIHSTLLKASMQTSSPASSSQPRQSLAPVLRHKNEGHGKAELAVNQRTSYSAEIQPSPGQNPGTELPPEERYGPTPEDFTALDLSLPNSPYSLDTPVEIEGSPLPAISSTDSPRRPQRTSRPSQRNLSTPSPSRIAAGVLAKRSLDTKDQGVLSDSFSELLQSWITSAGTSDPTRIQKKGSHLQIMPGATTNSPFQTLHVDKKTGPETASPAPLNITEDVAKFLRPPAERSVDVSTAALTQTHFHMAASSPESVIKTIREAADCQDSKCQKDTEATKDHFSRSHEAGHSGENVQIPQIFMKRTFLIPSVCFILLLITILIFSRQRNIRRLIKRPERGVETMRSNIY